MNSAPAGAPPMRMQVPSMPTRVGGLPDDVDDSGALQREVGRPAADRRRPPRRRPRAEASTMWVAPSSRGQGQAGRCRSTAMMVVAGVLTRGHDRGQTRPCPTPNTTRLDAGCGRAVLNTAPAPVDTPHASGPISSSGTSSGTRDQRRRPVVSAVGRERRLAEEVAGDGRRRRRDAALDVPPRRPPPTSASPRRRQ